MAIIRKGIKIGTFDIDLVYLEIEDLILTRQQKEYEQVDQVVNQQ